MRRSLLISLIHTELIRMGLCPPCGFLRQTSLCACQVLAWQASGCNCAMRVSHAVHNTGRWGNKNRFSTFRGPDPYIRSFVMFELIDDCSALFYGRMPTFGIHRWRRSIIVWLEFALGLLPYFLGNFGGRGGERVCFHALPTCP